MRDRAGEVPSLLSGLERQGLATAFEVILVDDGSIDATPAVLNAWVALDPVRRRLVRSSGRGPGHARNAGLRFAAGEVVAFTDSDTVPDADWLEKGLAAMARTGAAVVEGAIHADGGPPRPAFARVVTNETGGRYMTANMFYRRSVLESLGGFDEALSQFLEDSDLAFRAMDDGFTITFAPDAIVRHLVTTPTPAQLLRAALRLYWMPLFAAKHPARYWSQLRPVVRPFARRDLDVIAGVLAAVSIRRARGIGQVVVATVAVYGLVRALEVAHVREAPARTAPVRAALSVGLPFVRVAAVVAGCVRFRSPTW